jgi:uncharacterized protein YlxP (DUF503 family)
MVIGVCTADLYLPTTQSLKDKRRIIKSIIEKIRAKFNVSISEVDYQDQWGKATLGIAIVTTDSAYAQQVLNAATKVIDQNSEAEIYNLSVEIL